MFVEIRYLRLEGAWPIPEVVALNLSTFTLPIIMLCTDSTMKQTEMSYAVQNIIISHSSRICTQVDRNN